MSESTEQSTYATNAIVQNGATEEENGTISEVTTEETSTSAMVHVGAAAADAPDASDVSPDPEETSDDTLDVAEDVDVMHLSPKMQQALELLFTGHSATSVADQIGVHRNTIARWRTSHAAFIAAYNRRRAEEADNLSRRITGLLDTALSNVERHVTVRRKADPEQIKASLRLISTLARSRRVFAVGPTDPYAVLDQMIRHDRYLSDRNVHTYIDDKTRASYITTYTMRLTDEAPDCDLPFAPSKRVPKGTPRQQPIHPWDQKPKRNKRAKRDS